MNHPKISIIILNRNGREDTIECLESLYRIDYPNYEVILVDNFSTNESIMKIKDWIAGDIEVSSKYFKSTTCTHNISLIEYTNDELEDNSYYKSKKNADPLPSNQKLFLLKNDENYGFAQGNNIAIKQVLLEGSSDYTLLLNNDTVVTNNFLSELVKNISSGAKIGGCASKNYYYDNSSIIRYAGAKRSPYTGTTRHYGIDELDSETYNINKETGYCVGSCVLYNNEALHDIGLFKSHYFAYSEDVDLSIRMQKKGYKTMYIGSSSMYHKVGSSSKKISDYTAFLSTRNRVYMVKENYNIIIYTIFLFIFLLKSVKRSYSYKNIYYLKGYLFGLLNNIH